MSLQNFLNMDPHLLLSIVNMKLRDHFESLEDLARYYDIDLKELINKLAEAGYQYQASNHQFK